MMPQAMLNFASIWCIVVAVEMRPGERPKPIAIAAMDLATGILIDGLAFEDRLERGRDQD